MAEGPEIHQPHPLVTELKLLKWKLYLSGPAGVAVPVLQREAVEAGGCRGAWFSGRPSQALQHTSPSCPDPLKQLASQVPCPFYFPLLQKEQGSNIFLFAKSTAAWSNELWLSCQRVPAQSTPTPPADKDLEARPSSALTNNACHGRFLRPRKGGGSSRKESVGNMSVYTSGTYSQGRVAAHTWARSAPPTGDVWGRQVQGRPRAVLLSPQLDPVTPPACCLLDRQLLSPSLEQRQVTLWANNHRYIIWGWQVFGVGEYLG